uniref:Uncharacterized protein n=1 Tax=Anguilla anguilla TaxID=7936 RepID=A0A0E9TIA7_ANGAN
MPHSVLRNYKCQIAWYEDVKKFRNNAVNVRHLHLETEGLNQYSTR